MAWAHDTRRMSRHSRSTFGDGGGEPQQETYLLRPGMLATHNVVLRGCEQCPGSRRRPLADEIYRGTRSRLRQGTMAIQGEIR